MMGCSNVRLWNVHVVVVQVVFRPPPSRNCIETALKSSTERSIWVGIMVGLEMFVMLSLFKLIPSRICMEIALEMVLVEVSFGAAASRFINLSKSTHSPFITAIPFLRICVFYIESQCKCP